MANCVLRSFRHQHRCCKQNNLKKAQQVRDCMQNSVRVLPSVSVTQMHNACMAQIVIFCFCRYDDFGALPIWPWLWLGHKRNKVSFAPKTKGRTKHTFSWNYFSFDLCSCWTLLQHSSTMILEHRPTKS